MSDPPGLAFDPFATDYELGRPGWPPELLDRIEGDDVLDLAYEPPVGDAARAAPEAERRALRADLVDALDEVRYRLRLTARVFSARRT